MTSEVLRTHGWARRLSSQGRVYYCKGGQISWVHPGLSQLLLSLDQYDTIRYAAYRLSSKLIQVQKVLSTTLVSLALARSVLSHHGYSSPSSVLDSGELRELLQDLYSRAVKAMGRGRQGQCVGAREETEVMASLVEQILDPGHQGGVTVLGLKTVLAVFTGARLRDRLAFLFREHSDHQAKLTESSLTLLLRLLTRVPELLGEGIMFGGGVVERGVHSCLVAGGGRMVTEEVWMSWAAREPPELVWLTTAYRQGAAEQVLHNMRCSACHITKMEGLRYQCLQCLSYDLCQTCFFNGVSSKGHKPQHPVQEYCYPSTRKEEARAFFATLVNKFRARQSQPKVKKKTKRNLTADRIQNPTTCANTGSARWSHNKLSQLLLQVRTSPRTTPRGSKSSPASSGFCSGEDNDSPSVETSPTPSDPVYEDLKELDSPGLEWDEGGLELGDSAAFPETEQLQLSKRLANFENSIFRRDEETGNLHCYQHNTRRGRAAAMASIIGHLEEDHLTLRRRLSAAPELVQPVMEAQTQLNRLKGLMHNMFSSRSFLDRTEETTTENLPEETSSSVRCERTDYESTRLGSGELVKKGGEEISRVSGVETVRHESTRIQDDFRPPYTPRHRRFRREDGMENFSPIVLTEAARQVLKEHNSKEELEVAENEQSLERKARQRHSQPEYFTLVRLEDTEQDLTEETLVQSGETFSCTTSDRPSVSSSLSESSDPSLSRLGLNDLSCRLGGTGLYISRDNGLDITERLDDDEEDDEEQEDGVKEEKRDSKYEDTVEELERLMVKLSTVFDSFRNPSNECEKLPEHGGSREGIFGLVSDINKDLYSMLANSKESHI